VSGHVPTSELAHWKAGVAFLVTRPAETLIIIIIIIIIIIMVTMREAVKANEEVPRAIVYYRALQTLEYKRWRKKTED